jgi:hypothetical protein
MKKLFFLMSAVFILFLFAPPTFSMTIDPMDSPENLVISLVGSGITISNVTYTGDYDASGYFTGGVDAGIVIENGVVLTSGYAENLDGTSNTSDGITGINYVSGDSTLDALVSPYDTYDATVLEFDFVSVGDSAYFNYVFGSDEYNEYVDSPFNDVFGFFIGVTNVATIPGTTEAVAINNVNLGDYPEFYNNNDPSDLGSPTAYPFEYDGFTDPFTAEITGLTAGDTYHLKLAIADTSDSILDSGVFLQAGSFSETPVDPNTPVPEPATGLLYVLGAVGIAGITRKISKK